MTKKRLCLRRASPTKAKPFSSVRPSSRLMTWSLSVSGSSKRPDYSYTDEDKAALAALGEKLRVMLEEFRAQTPTLSANGSMYIPGEASILTL